MGQHGSPPSFTAAIWTTYHLAGASAGTVLASGSPLYGWIDQGAGGAYSVLDSSQPVAAGHGYWTWSACNRVVSLTDPTTQDVSLPLGSYHASMVGNPSSTSPASVTGHDFAARWDTGLNGGAGGYHISDYRQAQNLAVGEGSWVFSFVDTEVRISSPG